MGDMELMLFMDAIVLLSCTLLLVRYGRLAHSHPGTIYLFFHGYTVTFRLLAVALGAPTLFTWTGRYDPVTHAEIARAALMADIALVVMTAAWLRASAVYGNRATIRGADLEGRSCPLSIGRIWAVVIVAFPIGLAGLFSVALLPGRTMSGSNSPTDWETSTWISNTPTWVGLALLGLIYWYGFRLWLTAPMLLYFLVMSYQGFHRFRILIPVLLMIQIYLDRRKMTWPPLRIMALLVLMAALFFPLKTIGRMVQGGETAEAIMHASTQTIQTALSSGTDDTMFLDNFASAMTLIDERGEICLGSMYLPLLTLVVPRPLWLDKPGVADYIDRFSRPSRPMRKCGMIVTFLGEAYANFRYLGFVIVPYLLAYWLARAYFASYCKEYLSIGRFSYLLFACNLIQVYRDGLVSLVVFTFINMMPLMVIVILHWLIPVRHRFSVRAVRPEGSVHSSAPSVLTQ